MLSKLQEGQEKIIKNQDGMRLDSIENDVAGLRDEVTMLGKGQQENRESIEGLKDAVDCQYDSIQRLQFEQMRQEQYS